MIIIEIYGVLLEDGERLSEEIIRKLNFNFSAELEENKVSVIISSSKCYDSQMHNERLAKILTSGLDKARRVEKAIKDCLTCEKIFKVVCQQIVDLYK